MHLSASEIDISLQYRYANQYPKAIRLVAGGLINLKPPRHAPLQARGGR